MESFNTKAALQHRNIQSPAIVMVFGAPGAGKGTQAALIEQSYGLKQISTGEMLRAEIASGSDLGKRVEAVMAAGKFVDDPTIMKLLNKRMEGADCDKGVVLDGVPRTVPQAKALDEMLLASGGQVDHIFVLDVPEEELICRMYKRRALALQAEKEPRSDDNLHTFLERLQEYKDETLPILRHYESHGIIRKVDGTQSIQDVAAQIGVILEQGIEDPVTVARHTFDQQ